MTEPHPTLADERVLAILSPANLINLQVVKRELGKVFPRLAVVAPTDLDHLRTVVSRSARRMRVIIAVGGDGTLHQVLNAMDPARHILGILPSGTGNDFARLLGFPRGIRRCAAYLAKLRPQPTDYGNAGPWRYINSAGFGLDSATLKLRQERPGLLSRNYNLAFLRALAGLRCPALTVQLGSGEIRGKFFWVLAMNNLYIGGGTKIAPQASLDDGLLDVLLIRQVSKWKMLMLMPRAIAGTHLDLPEIEYLQLSEFTCSQDSPIDYLALDGELRYYGERAVRFWIKPGGVEFLR